MLNKNTSCYGFRRLPNLWLMGCSGSTAQSSIPPPKGAWTSYLSRVSGTRPRELGPVSKENLQDLTGWANRCWGGGMSLRSPPCKWIKSHQAFQAWNGGEHCEKEDPGQERGQCFLYSGCRAGRPWLCRSSGRPPPITGGLGSSDHIPLGDMSFNPNFTPNSVAFISAPFPGSQLPHL